MGYLPERGRLRTCSAPVCRSPSVYCYTMLPLDLHVLSLPLAFILSQDQTLHCKCCLILTINSQELTVQKSNYVTLEFTRSNLLKRCCCFQSFKELFYFFDTHFLNGSAKVRGFSIPPTIS